MGSGSSASSSLGASNPELHDLMVQYAKAGVLTSYNEVTRGLHPNGVGARNERGRAALQRTKYLDLKQGINNNKTMRGMKHFKNQSLTY